MNKKDLIMSVEKYAWGLAHKYRRDWTSTSELFQCAMLGACEAAERFDNRENVTFLTYARYYMLRSVRIFLYKNSHIVSLQNHGNSPDTKLFYHASELQDNYSKENKHEFCEKYNIKLEHLNDYLSISGKSDYGETDLDKIEGNKFLPDLERDELVEKVIEKVGSLPERQQEILAKIADGKSLAQIGKELTPPISGERVRQNLVTIKENIKSMFV